MSDASEIEEAQRLSAYREWRDGLIARVRDAVERERGCGGFNMLHSTLLDRIELILTAGDEAKDEQGGLVSVPIARRHARTMLVDLAEAYGIEVPDHV